MKNRKCPIHNTCIDYYNCGACETCEISKEILKLHRRIERLKKQNKWISVEERLPEKSGDVLCYKKNGISVLPYSHKHKAFNAYDSSYSAEYVIPVTHWMPLPKPPKEC